MPKKTVLTPLQIARLRNKGHSLQAIGKRAGISRERVRQILVKQGIKGRWQPPA